MIQALFNAADVDYRQWRLLTFTMLRMRWQAAPNVANAATKQAFGMLLLGFVLSFFGALGALMIVLNGDVLLTATVAVTASMMVVVSDVVMTQAGPLTSQDDYAVLGFRPISSRTFFAVRVTNMLIQSTIIAALTGWPPVLAYLLVRGPNPGLAVAAAFTIWWAAMFATIAFAGMYATLLRIAGAERVKRALSYLQMAAGLFTFGGFFLLTGVIDGPDVSGVVLPRSWWLLLYPAAWFAGALALIAGLSAGLLIALGATALFMTLSAIAAVRGTASSGYFERLSSLAAVAPASTTQPRTWLPSVLAFSRAEARAAGILIRAHFKHDMTFRMGVLGVLPMVVIYLFMGMKNGGFTDPLLRWQHRGAGSMAEMGILMMPSMIWQPLQVSPSFAASWIYFVCPADRGAIVRGARNALALTIVAPYLLVLGAVLIYFTGAVTHVLIHLAMLWLISTITLQLLALFSPGLPFAESPVGRSTTAASFISTMLVMMAGVGSAMALQLLVYPAPVRILPAALVLIALSFLIDRLTNAALKRRAALRQFAG